MLRYRDCLCLITLLVANFYLGSEETAAWESRESCRILNASNQGNGRQSPCVRACPKIDIASQLEHDDDRFGSIYRGLAAAVDVVGTIGASHPELHSGSLPWEIWEIQWHGTLVPLPHAHTPDKAPSGYHITLTTAATGPAMLCCCIP